MFGLQNLAKISNFNLIYRILLPICIILLPIMLFFGLKLALFDSPIDYQQGDAVRIMYIHVPSAWMSLLIYSIMALFAVFSFIFANPLLHIASRAIAPIGAVFAFITLVTGALWGKPIWGTYFVFDARLTSMLILFFLYVTYIIVVNSFEDKKKGEKIAAILAIIGFINIPLVKFSVEIFNSLHQPASIIRSGGVAIHQDMLNPLLIMFGSFFIYFVLFALIRIKILLNISRTPK